MKKIESFNNTKEDDNPIAGEATDNHESLTPTIAINIHNAKDDFYADSEIIVGRKADSVCRKSKPNDIYKVQSYEEIMGISPDYSEPLETRFTNINEEDFPIFSKQAELSGSIENKQDRTLSIPEACSKYIGATIQTIDAIEDSDLVIYLDKSARPVSWLVNEFWEEFSEKDRPAEANLAIDRIQWLRWAGVQVNADGRIDDNGVMRKATFIDFKKAIDEKKPDDYDTVFSKIRALFIPGGVTTDDPETIMNTLTGLEGKKITIIDEVNNSGATMDIARWLIQHAINAGNEDEESIQTHVYWKLPDLRSERYPDMEPQMNHSPVWYDPEKHDNWSGRGVLDINTEYFEKNYQIHQDPYTLAQKIGSIVLGEPMIIEEEPGQLSWELQREIREMHKKYREGHILPNLTTLKSEAMQNRVIDYLESLGVILAGKTGNPSEDANKYMTLMEKIRK